MKTTMLIVAALAAGLLASDQSAAQTAIDLTPEQRAAIREYVVKNKIMAVKAKIAGKIGEMVPDDVELRQIPPEWGPKLMRLRFGHIGNRVIIVDPETRTVVSVVD